MKKIRAREPLTDHVGFFRAKMADDILAKHLSAGLEDYLTDELWGCQTGDLWSYIQDSLDGGYSHDPF